MNEVLIKGGQLLLSLSILILLHELGHFIAARMFGVRVEKFYLFFNPWFSIFKVRKGDTEYGLGWLPLGGYVKISGMIDESMDKEQMKLPPQPWEFRTKPAWQRLIIMLGGIIMNVLLGIFIYWMILFVGGEQYFSAKDLKYGIATNEVGREIGFRDGDLVVAVDGAPVENFNKLPAAIIIDMAQSVTVLRDGKEVEISISETDLKNVIDSRSGSDFLSVRFPFMVNEVMPGSTARELELQPYDIVIAINGEPVIYYHEVKQKLQQYRGQEVAVTVWRDHQSVTSRATLSSDGLLGVKIVPPDRFISTKKTRYNLITAFPAGVDKAWQTLSGYVKQFALIFSPTVQGYKHVGGFISIANAFTPTWDWGAFWAFTGFLSIALAFMNLLPIPALDGGHVLFTLVEMLTRRKPSEKFLEYAQMAGMVILLALIVYANGNDILHLFR
jgi:regulator of sigma E protease